MDNSTGSAGYMDLGMQDSLKGIGNPESPWDGSSLSETGNGLTGIASQ